MKINSYKLINVETQEIISINPSIAVLKNIAKSFLSNTNNVGKRLQIILSDDNSIKADLTSYISSSNMPRMIRWNILQNRKDTSTIKQRRHRTIKLESEQIAKSMIDKEMSLFN